MKARLTIKEFDKDNNRLVLKHDIEFESTQDAIKNLMDIDRKMMKEHYSFTYEITEYGE